MALQDPQAEPSMEEILASIRRIISEEDQANQQQPPVLELTQTEEPALEDDIVFEEDEAPAPAPAAAAAEEEADPFAFEPEPEPAPAPVAAAVEPPADSIVSPPSAGAAAAALARLSGSLRIAETSGQTLEGVVRELLKPMLKEWLDRNLPAIVESRVEAELERIARLAR